MESYSDWQDPIVPDEDDRCRYLRYKFENGQMLRQIDVRDSGGILLYILAFQEEEDVAPQVGDEALRIDYTDINSTQKSITCTVVTVTQEMIDGTISPVNLAPTDIALTNSTVPEITGIGDTIGELSTFDPNVGDTHTYTIVSDPDDKFEISGNLLRLKNLLDYDTATTHIVTIRTTDQGLLFFEKTFTIVVTQQTEFLNDKATLFQGNTIQMDMSGDTAANILPSNGAFSVSVNVKKNDPIPFSNRELVFNGTDQFLKAPYDASFSGLTKLSVSGWITTDNTTGARAIASHFGAAGKRGWNFRHINGSLAVNLSQNGVAATTTNSSILIPVSTRTHVAFAFEGSTSNLKIWVNGVLGADVNVGLTSLFDNTTIPLRIGARGDTSFPEVSFFDGLLDDIVLFNTNLIQADVDAIYNSGTAEDVRLLSVNPNIISYYRMGDLDIAPTIKDVVGSNDLTMNNMTTSNIVKIGGAAIPSDDAPKNVTGLSIWADADDDSTFTLTGNSISQWADKSGNGNHLIAPLSDNEPTRTPNGYGSRNTVSFDGVDNYLTTNLAASKTEMTVIAVFKFNQLNQGASDFDYLYSHGTLAAETHSSISRYSAGSNADKYYLYDGSAVLNGPLLQGQVFKTFTQRLNSTATYHELFIDGVNQTVADNNTNFTLSGTFDLGRFQNGSHNLDGEIAEIIVYDNAISESDRIAVEAYLKTKWVDGIDTTQFKPVWTLGDTATLLYNESDTYKLTYIDGGLNKEIIAQSNDFPNNQYHNITSIYDSINGTINLNIDGVLESTANAVLPSRDTSIVRIAGDAGQTNFLDATVDEFSIFDEVVTVSEIYNDGFGQDILDNVNLPTPRVWLRMGDAPDDFLTPNGVIDRSTNGFNFTANNMSNSNIINDGLPISPLYVDILSLPFNGTDQRVLQPNTNAEFEFTDPFSISIWVKWNSGGATAQIMGNMYRDIGVNEYYGYRIRNLATTKPSFQLIGSDGGFIQKTIDYTGSLNLNQWYHLCGTYDGSGNASGMKLYIDGSLSTTTITNDGIVGTNTMINSHGISYGSRPDDNPSTPTQFFDGKLNESSVWNKELTLAEVIEIYNSGTAGDLFNHSAKTNLIAWTAFGDMTGDDNIKLVDRLGLMGDSTMINFPPNPFDSDVP